MRINVVNIEPTCFHENLDTEKLALTSFLLHAGWKHARHIPTHSRGGGMKLSFSFHEYMFISSE